VKGEKRATDDDYRSCQSLFGYAAALPTNDPAERVSSAPTKALKLNLPPVMRQVFECRRTGAGAYGQPPGRAPPTHARACPSTRTPVRDREPYGMSPLFVNANALS
jgi:hypothetical protein